MTLYYPNTVGDFDLVIPLDKSSINLGVEDLVVSFKYVNNKWYMDIWHESKYLTQNQAVKSNIDLLSKFSAYRLGKLIVYGDTSSPNCFSNWPVEIGYA